jgi:hypothetical protein
MFGPRPSDRLIEFEDFYLAPGTNEDTVTELGLWIEAKIEFPNPGAGEGEHGRSTAQTVHCSAESV